LEQSHLLNMIVPDTTLTNPNPSL